MLEPVPMQPAAFDGRESASAGPGEPGGLDDLRARIERAIGNLMVLRVTTVVGTVTAVGADQLDRVTGVTLGPENQQVACTSFNLLLGDGSVLMSPSFVADPAMRALHEEAVSQAHDIRERSVALLKALWDAFKDVIDQD